ncbi:MAG: hypothetical protein ABIZ34_10115 [Candidatus Limnocylindrales bacterium]
MLTHPSVRPAGLIFLFAVGVSGSVVPSVTEGGAGRFVTTPLAAPEPATRSETSALPAPAPAGTTDCPISGPTITSGDGLGLAFSSTGAIEGIANGGHCLARLPKAGGFSMRMIGESAGNPELLVNGGFDQVSGSGDLIRAVGWKVSGEAPKVVSSPRHDGSHAVRVKRGAIGTSGSLRQTLALEPGTSYVLAAWFRAGKPGVPSTYVQPTADSVTNPIVRSDVSPLVVSAEVKNASGHVIRTATLYGYTDLADWNRATAGFRTTSQPASVTITVRMVDGQGIAWFDSVSLRKLVAPTATGLSDSSVVQADAQALTQHATFTGQPLVLDATYSAQPLSLRIDGTIGLTPGVTGDKAFRVAFTVPIQAIGWSWADYAAASRVIAAAQPYDYDVGQEVPASRYPWATIFTAEDSLSIGAPLSVPRGYSLRYDSREGLVIEFDLALSSDATKLGGTTSFAIQLFTSDPAWGFRAATAKYYLVNPQDFARFPDPQHHLDGATFLNPDLDALDPNGLADGDQSTAFGLGVNIVGLGYKTNWGKKNVLWDDERGYPTVAYTHMWGDFREKCAVGVTDCPTLTYTQMIAALEEDAASSTSQRIRDESAASLGSGLRDINGRLRYDGHFTEYRIFEDSDPDIPGTPNWVDVIDRWMRDTAIATADAPPPGILDGFFSDSTSGYRNWGGVSDYDRSHWAIADSPLMFDYESGRVALRSYNANYEQLERLRAFAHDRDMFLSINFNANESTEGGYLGANLADHFLIEKGLPDRIYPRFDTTVDSFAMLKRTVANQKPVSTADQSACEADYPLSDLRARMQQSLFYGIYYGPCRWERTSWWGPGKRALFEEFAPYFRALAVAGWQPITNARSGSAWLRMERFGSLSEGTLVLTLRNETDTTRTASIVVGLDNIYDAPPTPIDHIRMTLDYQRTGETSTTRLVYADVPGSDVDRTLTLDAGKTTATLSVTLPPYTTGILMVRQP